MSDPAASSPDRLVAPDIAHLVTRATELLGQRERILIGIAGSPGAGKTTTAKALAGALDARESGSAAYLPMDGFHLANTTLDRLGRRDRKGAIDTFDGDGFVALLSRIAAERDATVYAPAFDRAVDEPVAGSIAIEPAARIVVVEGNYLLVDRAPWSAVPGLLVETWFCATPEDERMRRLVDRHIRHGRSPRAAAAWARDVDGANARLIEASAVRADLVLVGVRV